MVRRIREYSRIFGNASAATRLEQKTNDRAARCEAVISCTRRWYAEKNPLRRQ